MTCPFADGWKNEEGWLVMPDGKLVCLDWDDFCTECRIDDSKDCSFAINPAILVPAKEVTSK